MPRDYKYYLEDIIESIEKIQEYTIGYSFIQFRDDSKTIDAVIRNLEIIGEAARKIPEEIRHKSPQIEWRKIISLRNILIHEYPGIDLEVIWDIVQNKLSPLSKYMKQMMQSKA